MKPALERFKDLPELIFMIASHLNREDIHSFRLTCQRVQEICHRLFYRKLWLHDYWNESNLLEIAKHASSLHSLKVESLIFTRYYRCMFEIAPFEFLPPTSPSPQLANPVQLASILSRQTLEALGDIDCFPAQLLYCVCLSPRLTVLDLDLVMINTEFELSFLSKVFSSITTLRSLIVSFSTDVLSAEEVLQALVYGCPDNLESFSLFYDRVEEPEDYKDCDLYEEDAELKDLVLTLLGPMTARTEPLRRLTEWRLNISGKNIDRNAFFSILKFLPELISMDIPSIDCSENGDAHDIVARVVKACPKLKSVCKHHVYKDIGGTLMIAFLEKMPRNTVESVQVSSFTEDYEHLDEGLIAQKDSVKSIVLDECTMISMSSFVWIFHWCSFLEVFRISTNWQSKFTLPLNNLVSLTWASKKFRELKLCVQLDKYQQEPDKDDIASSTPMPTWTIGLERLCRQLGVLTDLRILDLRVAVGSRSNVTYKDKTFAGMLSLEDRTTGRFGWLQLLGGLKNLEQLHGSFNLDAMLDGLEFRQEEADWMVEHWPKLQFIEFYVHHEGERVILPPAVQSMVERLPGLKVARTYKGSYFEP